MMNLLEALTLEGEAMQRRAEYWDTHGECVECGAEYALAEEHYCDTEEE